MPESEPKPKLIELVGAGAGQGWKAVLRNGKPAVVHEIPVPPAEATAATPRLQRLYEHRHPALSPVLAWGTDQSGVWVAVEPNEGTPLSSILTRGPMTPGGAAALGAAVLSGVAALHEMGIAMGGFGATAVRINSNGEVRLAGHPAAAVRGAPSQSDLRADVRSCGMAVCAAFGVDPAGSPAPPSIPPGLVVTMRSMASGAMGPSADRAQGALREMAAPLLAPDRQMAAQSELATRSGGREVPAVTPFLAAEPGAAHSQPNTPAAGVPAAPSGSPPPPAPFLSSPPREDRTSRGSVYEAPDRPLQTYPSMPAITFPPAAPVPAAQPPAASAAVETPPSSPTVPTWAEASAPAAPAAEPVEPAVTSTNPPAPAPAPRAPLPWEEAAKEPEPPKPPPAPTWEPVPQPPPALDSPFATSPPAAAPPAPAPPAPVPTPPSTPAASPPPTGQTWTPVEAPVWKPGEAVPAEPLGTGYAIEAPNLDRTPSAAPSPTATPTPYLAAPPRAAVPTPAPAPRRPTVPPRPRFGGVGPAERPPWLVPAAAAVIVILVLGIFGVVVLGRLGGNGKVASGTTPSAHASSSPKGSPSSSPTSHQPQAVPSFGPAAAAPITKVQFCTTETPCKIAVGVADETGTNCDLSATCTIEVALYFSAGQRVPVHYDLKFFDRCTGQTTDLPGPPDYTPPGYAVVIPRDHWSVSLPAGTKSAALVAVSSKPGVAASAPLMLGSDSC